MKKILKILFYTLIILFIVLFTTPVLFKGKILKIVNDQLEKNIKADASIADVNISLIRNFPNLSVKLKNLNITGIDEFEGDTLVDVQSFNVVVNAISAIKMESIEVKKILIEKPYVNAIVLKNGKANWDIFPESDTAETEPADTATSEFDTKIEIKVFKIDDARISYRDDTSNMSASLSGFNFALTGDLSQDFSVLKIQSDCRELSFKMDGIPYLNKVKLDMLFDVDANLKESIFNLKENHIALNDFRLSFDGGVEMPDNGDIITDLNFETNNADFKTLLSLVPAIYLNDFKDLKTTGTMKLEGAVSGVLNEEYTPSADVTLLVHDATFSYPALPKKAEDIQIDIDVHYDGKQNDNTTLDINKFHASLGGNPIDLTLNLKTPISDPFTNGKLNASIDLGTFKDLIPLENTELTGIIKASLDWMGKYSSIEKERYQDFKADGNIEISGLYYNSADLPRPLTLKTAFIQFSPAFVEIKSLDIKFGSSDASIKGKVSNYIPFVLKDEVINGELGLVSMKMDLNEFLTGETETVEETPEDTTAATVFEVPANINFRFTSNIGNILFQKMDITNLIGVITIKEGRVLMENLSMNALDGSLALSGEYNTIDIKNPVADLKLAATNIDIPDAFQTFEVLGKISPVASKASGKVSLSLSFRSLLNSAMKPVLNTISGDGKLASKQIGIQQSDAFKKIGEALKTDALNDLVLNDVELEFEIQNGRLYVDPFDVKMKKILMTIKGEQTFDNQMNYDVNLNAPRELLGLENPAVNKLYDQAASKGLKIDKSEIVQLAVNISGKMNDPQVKVNLGEIAAENLKEQAGEAIKEVIETKTSELKEDAKAKAKEEADRIVKEAEKQAATIKSEAKKAADAVRAETNANADKLIREAKNPVAKTAAQQTAKKMRQEGEEKAQGMEKEAARKADNLVKDARARADDLLK